MAWTKNRVFRIPDDVYVKAQARAAEDGDTLTSAVVAFLRRYGDRRANPLNRRAPEVCVQDHAGPPETR